MSKAKNNRRQRTGSSGKNASSQTADAGRRKFIALGLSGLGAAAAAGLAGYKAGWFGSGAAVDSTSTAAAPVAQFKALPPASLPVDAANALRAAEEMVTHYARELNNPSALIHAVRAFGKNFTLNDGSKAVDNLCTKYAAEKELNGRKYIYFPRESEVHDNSFLKTLLEAGVSQDQTIMAGGNKYTLRDLGESAKALFRCDPLNLQRYDPQLLHQHLPWGLIAFSILIPQSNAKWVNAYGDSIDLHAVIDGSLKAFETSCDGVDESIANGSGESIEFFKEISQYSCYGMHTAYGYFSCLKNGYRGDNLPSRLQGVFDTLILRLEGDEVALEKSGQAVMAMGSRSQQYLNQIAAGPDGRSTAKGPAPAQTIEVMNLRHKIISIGHALEAINYAQLHRLFTLTPEQRRRLQEGERVLYRNIVRMRAIDMTPFLAWHSKFVSDNTIALGHAVRAMKILTPDNPDTVAGGFRRGGSS